MATRKVIPGFANPFSTRNAASRNLLLLGELLLRLHGTCPLGEKDHIGINTGDNLEGTDSEESLYVEPLIIPHDGL